MLPSVHSYGTLFAIVLMEDVVSAFKQYSGVKSALLHNILPSEVSRCRVLSDNFLSGW